MRFKIQHKTQALSPRCGSDTIRAPRAIAPTSASLAKRNRTPWASWAKDPLLNSEAALPGGT